MNEEYPIYNTTVLPYLYFPTNQEELIVRGLGGRHLTDDTTIECDIACRNGEEVTTVRVFYMQTLVSGQKPFYVTLPLFGTMQSVLVSWIGGFACTKDTNVWNIKLKLRKEQP